MIWSHLLFGSIWFCYEIVNLLAPKQWDILMVLSCAVPFGFTIMSWSFLWLRLFITFNAFLGIFISILFILGSIIIHSLFYKIKRQFRPITTEFLLMMFICIFLFILLLDNSFLQNGIGSSGTVYSDLPFHLGVITSFAYGANSENTTIYTPFYFGEKLSYPIIPDFFSSILISSGLASIRISICVPSIFLLISIVLSLHYFSFQFSSHKYVPEFSVFCFFMASGVGWRYIFIKECRDDINTNFVHTFCRNTHTFWIHSLIHFLLPQRSALFSMPIGISILSLFVFALDSKFKDRRSLFLAGILMGLFPMISAHTYIAIGEYAIFMCIYLFPYFDFKKWIPTIISWCYYGIPAILISIPQILWLFRVKRHGFMKFESITHETFPGPFTLKKFFRLWFDSLGTFVFLALIPSFFLIGKRQKSISLPSLGVFIISNFILYQPGAMDNNKVFFAGWYPIACTMVSNFLVCMLYKGSKNRSFMIFVLICVCFSFCIGSIICIVKALVLSFPLFSHDDLFLGEWIMKNTRKDTVFLSSTWHSNVAMTIGGRLLAMGYGGWVWTHGLNMNDRIRLIQELASNTHNTSLFDKFNIQYVIKRSDDQNLGFFFPDLNQSQNWILLYDSPMTKLYRIIHS